ncbi:RING/U-box superfamily protein [Hirschfeldia incana]|nr:RING/U-box superfamily protein [Hirschfeldia incana]
MGNICCCCCTTNSSPATETTPVQPHPPESPVNQAVSAAATSYSNHSSPAIMPERYCEGGSLGLMGNIFCCCLGVDGRRRRSNVPPMATETTPLHPHPPKFPVNRSVSAAATSSPDLCPHQYHSPPVTMPPPPYVVDEKAAVTVRSDTNLKKETLTLEPDPVNPTRLTRVVFSWRSRLMHSSPEGVMDGDRDNTRQVEEHDDGSCQDVSPANGVSAEITKEISPSQHERWRDLVFDIQFRAQENDFLRANGSFTPTPSPVSKRFNFSPMASPRIGRRGVSMSPPSSSRRSTTLKNVFNFKNRNNNADIEEGDGRYNKSNIPRTWCLTNLLTPRKSKKTKSLPVTPLTHSNPESMHGSYAVDQVTSMKRERTLPIRRSRSSPTLIDKDGNVKPVGVLRVVPTPSRLDTESLEMMHQHEDGGEDVPEEEAVCRICMVELGEDSEAFKMECMCKGELALAHRECTIKWFTIKGNVTCDVCKQDVTNLPVTLLLVEDDPHGDWSREEEHTEISDMNEWQDVPILVTLSVLAYFSFLEQLLVMDMKSSAVAVALPFACIIGLLGSVTSTTMVKRKYVWLFATIQYCFVILFGHVFYSRLNVKQPVTCIVLATMVGFGLTMSGAAVITVFMEWRRNHAHHRHQPASTGQVVTPPFQTAENR